MVPMPWSPAKTRFQTLVLDSEKIENRKTKDLIVALRFIVETLCKRDMDKETNFWFEQVMNGKNGISLRWHNENYQKTNEELQYAKRAFESSQAKLASVIKERDRLADQLAREEHDPSKECTTQGQELQAAINTGDLDAVIKMLYERPSLYTSEPDEPDNVKMFGVINEVRWQLRNAMDVLDAITCKLSADYRREHPEECADAAED